MTILETDVTHRYYSAQFKDEQLGYRQIKISSRTHKKNVAGLVTSQSPCSLFHDPMPQKNVNYFKCVYLAR